MLLWDTYVICGYISLRLDGRIYNRVFFLLSTTPGWNIRMAFQVFAIANQLYWTPFTAFNDGACAVIQAAEDLGFAAEYVRNAFVEVGINPCGHAKEGVHALHDIRALANETLQFVFIVDDVLHEVYTTSIISLRTIRIHLQSEHLQIRFFRIYRMKRSSFLTPNPAGMPSRWTLWSLCLPWIFMP